MENTKPNTRNKKTSTKNYTLLVLESKNFEKKVTNLFKDLEENKRMRDVFMESPTETLLIKLFPEDFKKIPPQRISRANRFLYSVLANKKFHEWAKDYQENLIKELKESKSTRLDKNQIIKDFSKALIEYGDEDIVFSLVNREVGEISGMQEVADVAVAWETLFAAVAVAFVFLLVVAVAGVVTDPLTPSISFRELQSVADQLIAKAEELKTLGET